jgi:hypothetical protein
MVRLRALAFPPQTDLTIMKTPLPDHLQETDIPLPILFNAWKHHAGALRQRIREAADAGPEGLDRLAESLVVLGSELMDLYHGRFTPTEIAERLLDALRQQNRLDREAFRTWVTANGGYTVLPLEDGSRWVFRMGDEDERYVHLHPARHAPQTVRVRANVLKTAVLALASAELEGGDPLDRQRVNRVRQQYLGLAPLGRHLKSDQGGIGEVIALLAEGE